MKKSFLIARSNLRRSRGQTSAIVVLILVASIMMNLWLMLATDYKSNFDRWHDKLNAEHVTLAVGRDDSDLRAFVIKTLKEDERTAQYCMDDALLSVGKFDYNGGTLNTEIVFLKKDTALNRSVGRVEIVENSKYTSGVYLPLLYNNDFAVGDKIEITLGNNVVNYTVCGFINSVMAGSQNCSMIELLLTEDKYEQLEEDGLALKSTLVSVRINDKSENEDFESTIKNALTAKYPSLYNLSNSYKSVSTARYISQMICSGIVSAMAFLVTLIALVVIASNVMNYIQENMKNLGALKAIGYRSRQIIAALMVQFLSVTLIAALVGIGLSYCLFPSVNAMMISQTGIPYDMRFLPLPFLLTLAIMCGAVALAVWMSARKIKIIEPIVALRQGVQTHNFKRNHVPLDKTHAPLNVALALKTTLSGVKQNVTVCITMLVISLVVVFSGLMLENMIFNMKPFLNLIVGESADSLITVTAEVENDFLKALAKDERVTKAYLFTSMEVGHVGGTTLTANISDDFSKLNNQAVCIEGRFPKYDNEVAIAAKYAKEQGLNVGDEITLTSDGKKAVYIISGYTQTSNYLGKDCLLTRDGYEHIGEIQSPGYYINLSDDVDVDKFNDDISDKFVGEVSNTTNVKATIEGTAGVYISLMTAIVIAILALSAIVITFVLYLLVRTMLNSKKRDYGIMKALGFTTGQLVLQTAISFMPTLIISTIVGLVVSDAVINPLTAVFLSGIGVVKCTFAVPVEFSIIAGIGLVIFAFAMVCLMSLRIKKIDPKTLLIGE